MGMNISVEIADRRKHKDALAKVFGHFAYVDGKFSTYKKESEISRINRGEIKESEYSPDMLAVLSLAEKTRKETSGYFDIRASDGKLDPSGIVKGWAIKTAADILSGDGYDNFYINAGGDIEARGVNQKGEPWKIGIRNPFSPEKEIIKVVSLGGDTGKNGMATSGTYARGSHIYNPQKRDDSLSEIVSVTVIGPDAYEADRFATAAFAMGPFGIYFLEKLKGFEGYMVDRRGIATFTSNFEKFSNNDRSPETFSSAASSNAAAREAALGEAGQGQAPRGKFSSTGRRRN